MTEQDHTEGKKVPDSLTSKGYRFRTTTSDENWEPLSYVSAYPDEDYPRRILQAHLDNCDGIMVGDSPIVHIVNDATDQRRRILTKFLADQSELSALKQENERLKEEYNDLSDHSDKQAEEINKLYSETQRLNIESFDRIKSLESQLAEKDQFAIKFAFYMNNEAWEYDHVHQKTHTLNEHLEYFKQLRKNNG